MSKTNLLKAALISIFLVSQSIAQVNTSTCEQKLDDLVNKWVDLRNDIVKTHIADLKDTILDLEKGIYLPAAFSSDHEISLPIPEPLYHSIKNIIHLIEKTINTQEKLIELSKAKDCEENIYILIAHDLLDADLIGKTGLFAALNIFINIIIHEAPRYKPLSEIQTTALMSIRDESYAALLGLFELYPAHIHLHHIKDSFLEFERTSSNKKMLIHITR
ncbi:MAG TPA: hypothetical protein DIU37_00860 [Opitutae bacterium]|nr:hypothetical protein [Opitutae bacterium]|tara:strand:- start:2815 stop:3468 length:654 start_codon:yes stop_codon:yes gene_type:complete